MMLIQTLILLLVAALLVVVALVVFRKRVGALPAVKRMTLGPPPPSSGANLAAVVEPPVRAGEVGIAHTPLRPAGKARFGDHLVDVLTEGDFVARGRPVRVIKVSGQQVFVAETCS
jgi:membrane-bound serine protease (ClpP class)